MVVGSHYFKFVDKTPGIVLVLAPLGAVPKIAAAIAD